MRAVCRVLVGMGRVARMGACVPHWWCALRPAADALRTVTRPATKVRAVRLVLSTVGRGGGMWEWVLVCVMALPVADALRTVTRPSTRCAQC